MFPEMNLIEEEQQETYSFNGKSFLYDFKNGDFVYKNGAPVIVEGKAALLVWIEKVIRTEKFRFNIHRDIDYGVTIEDLISGQFPRAFTESELEREITEALLKNKYILDVSGWAFEYEGSTLIISFAVTTDDESFIYTAVIE